MSGLFGGPESQTVKTEIPDWQKTHLTGNARGPGILNRAKSMSKEGPEGVYHAGRGLRGLDRGRESLMSTDSMLRDTVEGDYLGGGAFMDAYGEDILQGVDSRFGSAGRTGSGYHSQVATKELGDAASRLYESERGRQMQAAGMIPQVSNASYQNASQALNLANFEDEQEWQNLQRYADLVYGAPTGSTQTTPLHSNPLGSAIGGGLAGFAATDSPWGAGIGVLGGLL